MLSYANKRVKHILVEATDEPKTDDIFTISMRPYKNVEYIPASTLSLLMSHYFPSAEMCHTYNDFHYVYKIQVKDLLVGPIRNWEYNRPPDLARCPDIARYIYNSKNGLDTMLFLSYNNCKEIFEVLDGIHRVTAIKMIAEENQKPRDLLCPSEFGANGDAHWLYNEYMLVNLRFNANLGTLIDVFRTLNKSQTVPELYIKDQTREKRDIIDRVADEWSVLYKKHFSSSANPIIGNTNRNRFVELLDHIYEKYKIDDTSSLTHLLVKANQRIAENMPVKASIDVRLKCKDSGCFLFLYKNDKLMDFI
jgi:hypothetical protein